METNLLENKERMKQEIKIVLMENEFMKTQERYINHAKLILVSNNNDFIPTLFERIDYPGTIEEKVDYAINKKLEDGYNYILALRNDEVVGFTEFIKGDYVYKGESKRSINVGMSAVHKKVHGQGVAKLLYSLLDSLVETLDVEIITRKTWSTNERQLKLYEKFGYTETERRKNLRGEGIDSITFCKLFKT